MSDTETSFYARLHGDAIEAKLAVLDAIVRSIAEGQPQAEQLEIIGNHLNACDAVDDEGIALWERAKAKATSTLTVPRPTPDEDGLYSLFGHQKVWAHQYGAVCMDTDTTFRHSMFTPDLAEALGAALIAAAQDARPLAVRFGAAGASGTGEAE